MLDSSKFKYFERFENIDSEEHFNKLINLAIHTYFEILNTKTYSKSEMIRKRENEYRDDFVDTLLEIQEDYGFNNLIINCEPQERREYVEERGLLDIKIQYQTLQNIHINKYYHTIECKRFGNDLKIKENYYENGILEFLEGKYSRNANYAGMICFIEEFKNNWNMDKIIIKINEKLNENNISFLNNNPHEEYEHVYTLTTLRDYNNKNIHIIHLMLDYTSIFSNN